MSADSSDRSLTRPLVNLRTASVREGGPYRPREALWGRAAGPRDHAEHLDAWLTDEGYNCWQDVANEVWGRSIARMPLDVANLVVTEMATFEPCQFEDQDTPAGAPPGTCRDMVPDDECEWCVPCLAREAMGR